MPDRKGPFFRQSELKLQIREPFLAVMISIGAEKKIKTFISNLQICDKKVKNCMVTKYVALFGGILDG